MSAEWGGQSMLLPPASRQVSEVTELCQSGACSEVEQSCRALCWDVTSGKVSGRLDGNAVVSALALRLCENYIKLDDFITKKVSVPK
jgi:hypothetical protein